MIKHLAIGYACNLNDLFVRFPYEKCKSIIQNYLTKASRRRKIKQVFRAGINVILNDIIDNNNTFELPAFKYYKGQIYFEAIAGERFKQARKNGKFKDIDFLESLFTGFQLYLHVSGKRDNFLSRKKFPIYLGKIHKDKITYNTNLGKKYC